MPGEGVDAALGGAVGAHRLDPDRAEAGREVDDRAARPLLDQQPGHLAGDADRRGQVDGQDGVDLVVGGVEDQIRVVLRGVVVGRADIVLDGIVESPLGGRQLDLDVADLAGGDRRVQ